MFKKSVVIKRRYLKLPVFDGRSLVLTTLLICGIFIGVTALKNSDNAFRKALSEIICDYYSERKNEALINCICESSLINLGIPLLVFVLGFCAIGAPIIYCVPIASGLVFGLITGVFYIDFGLNGLSYCALAIIPAAAVLSAVSIKACCISGDMSVKMLACATGACEDKQNILKDYLKSYSLKLIPLSAAILLNSGALKLFGGLFGFI